MNSLLTQLKDPENYDKAYRAYYYCLDPNHCRFGDVIDLLKKYDDLILLLDYILDEDEKDSYKNKPCNYTLENEFVGTLHWSLRYEEPDEDELNSADSRNNYEKIDPELFKHITKYVDLYSIKKFKKARYCRVVEKTVL